MPVKDKILQQTPIYFRFVWCQYRRHEACRRVIRKDGNLYVCNCRCHTARKLVLGA